MYPRLPPHLYGVCHIFLVANTILFLAQHAPAQETWINTGIAPGGTNEWHNTGSWTTANIPDLATEVAQFNEPIDEVPSVTPGAAPDITVTHPGGPGTPTTVLGIVFNDSDGNGSGAFNNGRSSSSPAVQFSGDPLAVGADGIDILDGALNGIADIPANIGNHRADFQNTIIMTADQAWYAGRRNVAGGNINAKIEIEGILTDDGTAHCLTKEGQGGIDFEGSTNNTFTGALVIDRGPVGLNRNNGTDTITGTGVLINRGSLTQSGNAARGSDQIVDTAIVAFAQDGSSNETWSLNDNTETVANWGGGDADDNLNLDNTTSAASLSFGGDNLNSSFGGRIRRQGTLNKNGTGIWTLTSTGSDHTNVGNPVVDFDINVNAGTFQMNGVHDENDQSGAKTRGFYTIGPGATLIGTGEVVGTVIVQSGGTFAPGTQAVAPGASIKGQNLTDTTGAPADNDLDTFIAGNLQLLAGSTTTMQIAAPTFIDTEVATDPDPIPLVANIPGDHGVELADGFVGDGGPHDHVQVGGTLTLTAGGTIDVDGTLIGGAYALGQVFNLFNFTTLVNSGFDLGPRFRSGANSAFYDLKLPDLTAAGATLRWDTSLFLSDGTLVIVPAPEPSRGLLLITFFFSVACRRRR